MKKIIRDKYVDIIDKADLCTCDNENERLLRLFLKVSEEMAELNDSDFKDVDEYADVLEVLFEMAKMNDISPEQINDARLEKRERLGGFETGLLLDRKVST